MKFNLKNIPSGLFILFLLVWGCLNLIQAGLTPLNNDEAYYWMYSKYLDWGYFDHPPMIALMIKAGYLLFRNEIGVRLLVVLSEIFTLLIIWKLLDQSFRQYSKNVLLFIIVIAALPVFNIYGFIATPDSPLLLFAAVFLLVYKRFADKQSIQNTILLGVSMAALVYSKYHGVLLILLVVLSNLSLLTEKRFYYATAVALVLFLPHFYWQYSNGFPSVKYHLVERVSGFDPGHVPEYLLNLLIIHNPFILPICIWVIIRSKAKDKFEKALRYCVAGFFLFFFAASFRYHIEPQWTAVASIPMIILLFNNLDIESKSANYLKWVAILFLPLMLFARSAFMVDYLPVAYLKNKYHKTRMRAEEIEKIAGERPVIFTNSYQDASEYSFYTGKFALSLNNKDYRKNQYDIWDFEEQVHGKEILYVPHFLTPSVKSQLTEYVFTDGDSLFARVFTDFQSLQRKCAILGNDHLFFSRRDTNIVNFKIFNPYPYSINLKHKELPVVFQLAFIKNGSLEIKKNIDLPPDISTLSPGDTIRADFRFTLSELTAGEYKIAICSETGMLYDIYNSNFIDVIVNDEK